MVTLYTQVPERVLGDLAASSFPKGYALSSSLDNVIDDALDEMKVEGEAYVVLSLEIPENLIAVREDDVLDAVAEELDVDPGEVREEDMPRTVLQALELTEEAELAVSVPVGNAKVLGVPVELFDEDLTLGERRAGVWYKFPHAPVGLEELKERFWPGIFKKIFAPRKRRIP